MGNRITALSLTLALGTFAVADAAPAAPILGSWAGSGTAQSNKGRKESVRCRVRYTKDSGKTFGFSGSCTSLGQTKSGRGRLVKSGNNRYAGRLFDSEHTVSGRIVVTVKGNRQFLTVTNEMGSARLTLVRR